MEEYFLFIDTETSGLPPKLDTPIAQIEKWPFVVQISWSVYSGDAQLIKKENYFIFDQSITIDKSAEQVHGITLDALSFRGLRRKVVMLKLIKDLKKYNPIIVGHYIDFDLKMIEVALFRSGLKYPIHKSRKFCTMLATSEYSRLPNSTYPKLGDLYLSLFGEKMEQEHNAEFDVLATSKCFFKLLEKGQIDHDSIRLQTKLRSKTTNQTQQFGCGLHVFVFILLIALISFL